MKVKIIKFLSCSLFYIPTCSNLVYYVEKSEMEMRKLFQQKYILRVLTFLVLALAIINVSAPKIEEYNSAVSKRQQELRREAGTIDKQAISFGLYSFETPNEAYVFFLVMLFFSLIFTKRILLSFLFLFLFYVQLGSIVSSLIKADYYPYPEDYGVDFQLLLTPFLLILSFWLAISVCRFFSQRFQSNFFLK